jgi:hypothetical protein
LIWKPPYPWFGGKSRIASQIWERFGDVRNFVDPFFGSNAILYHRPQPFVGTETINDTDGFVANFWRALRADPEAVAHHAEWPVNENDLHARHSWLVGQRDALVPRLEGDPEFFCPKIAGWWAWGIACWIGSGFCSGKGPWQVVTGEDGARKLVHLGSAGQGVNRQLVHLGSAGQGVNRAEGSTASGSELLEYFEKLSVRLRRVRVCCGDWKRVCGPTPTVYLGLTAVLLDPPYADTAKRDPNLYRIDSESVAHAVREWAIANGDNPKMRIALCGYDGEHKMPKSWSELAWKAKGGYGSQKRCRGGHSVNSHRERIWFSPHCLAPSRAKEA